MSESSSSSVDDADAHEAGSDWLVLPKEVAAEVFRHLDVVDRTNLRLTCRGVRRLVDSATWALSPKLLKMREVAELFPSLQHLDVSAQVTDRRSRDGERWTAAENSGDVAGLDAVGQLTALTYLSFRSNPSMSFMGLGPCLSLQPSLQPSFARLTNLVSLDIAGTDVPQLSILAVLTGLRSLSFSGERLLSVSGLSMLQQLGRLTCLDASKMCLETVPLIKLSLLSQLSRLQCLRLSQLDAEPSMAFKSLPMLPTQGPHAEPAARRLVEPMAQLPPTPGEPPGGAAAIYVMTQVAREWGALPCLQELDLSRSALVGDAMLDALSFSPLASKLTSLDLSGCNCMASRALEAAARISSLQALKLDDCWSCWSDAVSQLTQLQSCSMADARGVPLEALLSLLCHSTSLRALNMRGVSLQGDADGEEVDLGRLDWELCSPRCLQSLDVSSDFAPKLTLPDICSLFSPARLPLCAPAECGRATLAHWPLSCLTLLACTPSGPLPGVPAAFTSLQVLRLQGYTTWPLKLYQLNELLAGLSSLRELTVAPGTVYGGFGRCPHMLHPDPADGSGGVHVSHLSQLRSLSVCPLPLHLGSFACSGSVLRSSCSQLQCLDLTRQPDITDKDLREVAALTGLTKLSLGACFSITDVGISELSNLVKLQSLSLDHCHQVGVPALVGVLRALRFLEFLDITGLTLGPAVVDALIGCPRLQTLVASNCTGLDRATCDRLALCSRLRYLTLGGTLPRTELHDISTAFPHWTRVSGW